MYSSYTHTHTHTHTHTLTHANTLTHTHTHCGYLCSKIHQLGPNMHSFQLHQTLRLVGHQAWLDTAQRVRHALNITQVCRTDNK